MKKTILFLSIFSLFLIVVPAKADVNPELNPVCWHQQPCEAQRKILGADPKSTGWVSGSAPCDLSGWGKCLPPLSTNTNISFGGQTKFESIGQFLKYNYNLALVVAGILAAIMIAVAGIQWTTSGGNSEMITSAKKRIGGALIGLTIAYLSYTILNTVNPALVNLQLPQPFLIRAIQMIVGKNCVDLESKIKVAPVKDSKESPPESAYLDPFKELATSTICATDTNDAESINPLREDLTNCGQSYMIKDSGGMTCVGSKCVTGKVCRDGKCGDLFPGVFTVPSSTPVSTSTATLLFGQQPQTPTSTSGPAAPTTTFTGSGSPNQGIQGKISYSNGKFVDWIVPYIICKDGRAFPAVYVAVASALNTGADTKEYNIFDDHELEQSIAQCGGDKEVLGYFFKVELNDPTGGWASITSDDEWYGGLSFCSNITGGSSCGFLGRNNVDDYLDFAASTVSLNGQYIPISAMRKGFVCDFNFNEAATPSIGKGLVETTVSGAMDQYLPDKLNTLLKNGTLLSKESLISGINYSCPAFDKAASAFHDKLEKWRCTCGKEKNLSKCANY